MRAYPPFNTARTHAQTTPRLMPCYSMENLTVLSSCEFDGHMVNVQVANKQWRNVAPTT